MKTLVKTNGGLVPSMNKWFDNFWGVDDYLNEDFFKFRTRWVPAVNIREEKDAFIVEMAAPGLEKNDFNVELDNGMLCISVEKEETKENKDANYTRKEFNFRSFNRTFTLPENVDKKHITARYVDGVLNLEMKKLVVTKPEAKKIKIT